MKTLLISLLLLQSALLLPPRTALENPAVAASKVPPKIQKDYDKLWSQFVAAKSDSQLARDLDNFVKKQKSFDPAVTLQAYIELYKGNDAGAAQKFQQAFSLNPSNRIALYYLAELAYAHQDYSQANRFYSLLLSLDSNRTDVEPKRQRALLLATDQLLRSAALAEKDNRLSDAEQLYKQALTILPNDPTLHLRLADLLAKENKVDEAAGQRKTSEELRPRQKEIVRSNPEPKGDDLDDLGRWGSAIEMFREIQAAPSLTRERAAAIIVRYFPQVTQRPQTPQIVTDIDTSWARSEIQAVVDLGLMDTFANHTFDPRASVSRGDLAAALARLIQILGLPPVTSTPIPTPDVADTNTQYSDIRLVLGRGLMTLQDSGAFGVSDNVSGQDAIRAAERLLRSFQQAQR
jgi:tetratricopeptide (TPR) repeat protein